jgi:hypothetical protein
MESVDNRIDDDGGDAALDKEVIMEIYSRDRLLFVSEGIESPHNIN